MALSRHSSARALAADGGGISRNCRPACGGWGGGLDGTENKIRRVGVLGAKCLLCEVPLAGEQERD